MAVTRVNNGMKNDISHSALKSDAFKPPDKVSAGGLNNNEDHPAATLHISDNAKKLAFGNGDAAAMDDTFTKTFPEVNTHKADLKIKTTAQRYAALRDEIMNKYKDSENEMNLQMRKLNEVFKLFLSTQK